MKLKKATEIKRIGTPANLPLYMLKCDVGQAKVGSRQVFITWGLSLTEEDLESYSHFRIEAAVQTGSCGGRPQYEIEIPASVAKTIPLCLKVETGWAPVV